MNKKNESNIRRRHNKLITAVWQANLQLHAAGLVPLTWGNVSGLDRKSGLVAIKPSGVAYQELKADDIVLADLNGNTLASHLRPSSDLPTHLALYRAFPALGGVAHSHSTYATAFGQAGKALPCLGTTHADYFLGEVPVTDVMRSHEVRGDYELQTGDKIVQKFNRLRRDPMNCPAVLVVNHGPFAWGENAQKAVENAIVLEEVCRMAWLTWSLNADARPIADYLLQKHYCRKHGKGAYYGQDRVK